MVSYLWQAGRHGFDGVYAETMSGLEEIELRTTLIEAIDMVLIEMYALTKS